MQSELNELRLKVEFLNKTVSVLVAFITLVGLRKVIKDMNKHLAQEKHTFISDLKFILPYSSVIGLFIGALIYK